MSRGMAKTNANGGIYHPGWRYELPKKMEVRVAYLELVEENGEHRMTVKDVLERAKVSWHYANAIMKEYKESDYLADPFEVQTKLSRLMVFA
jgi:hypothetical protein